MKKVVIVLAATMLLWPGVGQTQQTPQPQQPQPQARSTASEFGMSWLAPVLSLVYFPVKFCVGGVAGAVLGGVSGWATGGNEQAAEGIWRPMVGGTYFITPQILTGEQPFLPFNGGPYAPPPAGSAPSGSMGSMYTRP
jgi:hypothetical protein